MKKENFKNFIATGIVATCSIYGVQAIAISLYNSFNEDTYNMKMTSLYNEIWTHIGKTDVSVEVSKYQSLDNEAPALYEFGILPHIGQNKVQLHGYLPNGKDVIKKAQEMRLKSELSNSFKF